MCHFSWLGMRDSNPRSWDQNPLPYHLANPHYWIIGLTNCSIKEGESQDLRKSPVVTITTLMNTSAIMATCPQPSGMSSLAPKYATLAAWPLTSAGTMRAIQASGTTHARTRTHQRASGLSASGKKYATASTSPITRSAATTILA